MALSQLSDQAFSNAIIEIHRLHSEIRGLLLTGFDKAVRAGELLSGVKAALKHGEWLPWLKEHAPFDQKTAWNYMNCFERRAEIRQKLGNNPNLIDAYRFPIGDGLNGSGLPAQLHEPNFHSQFVKIKQTGIGLFNHWIQRRPLNQWQTEELFDTLASVEPWLEVSKVIKQELSTRPDAPRGY